jgi:hypothetical protein
MFCTKLNKEITFEECYSCFLKTGVYLGVKICKEKNIKITLENETNFNMV